MNRVREFAENEVSKSEFEESSDDMAFVFVADEENENGWDSVKIKLMASRSTIDDVTTNSAFLANDVMSLQVWTCVFVVL